MLYAKVHHTNSSKRKAQTQTSIQIEESRLIFFLELPDDSQRGYLGGCSVTLLGNVVFNVKHILQIAEACSLKMYSLIIWFRIIPNLGKTQNMEFIMAYYGNQML